jgi:2-succinyl-5-enolpyruvyl-6-hydroxy-3-cyclohexene-1-carboxylate synthase
MTASNKEEFESVYKKFLSPEIGDKSIILEVFTDEQNESDALKILNGIEKSTENKRKDVIKKIIGENTAHTIKRIIDKL